MITLSDLKSMSDADLAALPRDADVRLRDMIRVWPRYVRVLWQAGGFVNRLKACFCVLIPIMLIFAIPALLHAAPDLAKYHAQRRGVDVDRWLE